MEPSQRFFVNFNRNSVGFQTPPTGEPLPNEPSHYRFVNGVLLPPTPVTSFQPIFISKTRPAPSFKSSSSTIDDEPSVVVIRPESETSTIISNPAEASTMIVNPEMSVDVSRPLVPFGHSKNEEMFPVDEKVDIKPKFKCPKKFDDAKCKVGDVDAYLKFLLNEHQIEAGVNCLQYDDPNGGKHKASLLPKGPVQADKLGGPVFQRLHFWIKDVNGLPRRSKQNSIMNELKRVRYMGIPLNRLILDYEMNTAEREKQKIRQKMNSSQISNEEINVEAENIQNSQSSSSSIFNSQSSLLNEENKENENNNDEDNFSMLSQQSTTEPKLKPLIPQHVRSKFMEEIRARAGSNLHEERMIFKKEMALKMIRRLNAEKLRNDGKIRI